MDFKINGNKNMDILAGVHGSFITQADNLLSGGIIHTVLSDYGDMLFQEIPAEFGSIWLSMYNMVHTAKLSAEANMPSLEAMHMLAGNVNYAPDGLEHDVTMKARHWQMMYLPHVSNKVVFPAGTKLITLDFHYSTSWLEKLSVYFKDLDVFLNKVANNKAAIITPKPIPMPDPVHNLMAKFFEARKTEHDQNLFLDRHMLDWVACSLESPYLSDVEPLYIRAEEEKRLVEVFEYMMQHLSDQMSIPFLSRMAHMNEYKFKRAFKARFKQPVHNLLMQERLKKSIELLPDQQLSLTEIANICGYDTLAAFTKVFKKKFGRPPSAYRT